ncbi:MAG: HAMP domain-containing protein [Anaerolineaceae bacterium]|nr:HAMP domain-containing protein [Anaerolineaceae bacterium]MCB9101389.1 HAMP domain-containing protein [Anaerolineales bacterium]
MKAPSPYFDPSEFTEDSDDTRPYNLKNRMVRSVNKLPLTRRVHRLALRVASYFHRLQWKLTFAYTLFTAGTILILAIVALALLWYLNFQSNLYPNAVADAMTKGVPPLVDFLEQDPPDQAGLQRWLDDAIKANYLIMNVPKDKTGQDAETRIPGFFGEVELAAIVDPNGNVLAVSADEAIAPNEALQGYLSPQAATVFEAALRGESDLAQLATRGDGSLTAAVPILGRDNRVVGAMLFATPAFPISESEFLQKVLQQMILPFAGIMLVVGVVVGALFGFLIARGLTRRLRNLSEAADAWSEGNFQVLAQDNAGDELSRLAGHLNHMAIQLQNLLQTRQELAGLEERNRLARELHDSVKQQVFATAMQVGAAKALIDRQPEQVKPHLQEAEQLVREAQQELTTLILELRPAALEGQGLARALNHYVADWSRQTKIKADVRISGERPLPLSLEQTLFRVAQEALANIARHSRATAVEIYLGWEADEIRLVISDNGCGFNVSQINGKGVGLQSMRERIEVLGGYFFVKSQPGIGTQVIAQIVNPEKRSAS